MYTEQPTRAFTAGEALARRRLVKLSGASAVYADAGDEFFGVTEYAIAIAAKGSIRNKLAGGTFEVTAAAAITAGKMIYPADDGKVSMTPAGKACGLAIEAATADGDLIEAILLDLDPQFANMTFEAVSDNLTLDVEDVGKVMLVTADAKTITLPATSAGLRFIIMNGGADGTVAVNVSPQSDDKIMGPDITGTNNKDQINTQTTAERGDFIDILGGHADGYTILAVRGTWAEEG